MTSGLLYDSSWSRPSGTVWLCLAEAEGESGLDLPESLPATRGPTFRGSILHHPSSIFSRSRSIFKFTANLMLLIGGAGVLLTMLPVAAIEIKYNLANLANSPNSANLSSLPTPDTGVSLGDLVGPINDTQAFSVNIPKISASSVVIPNVDPADPKIYMEALKKGVAHAKGTGLPAVASAQAGLPGVQSDINRTIYLFAHSTSAPSLVAQYNAQFYLLNKLETGDEINITFWAKNYKYRVTEIKITDPGDVSFLTPQTGKEILVLATCWPPGTTFKRLLVLAEREN